MKLHSYPTVTAKHCESKLEWADYKIWC